MAEDTTNAVDNTPVTPPKRNKWLVPILVAVIAIVGLCALIFSMPKPRDWLIDQYNYNIVDARHPVTDEEWFFSRAVRYHELGRTKLAIRTFSKILFSQGGRLNPADAYQRESLFNIGTIYYQLGQNSQNDRKKQDRYYQNAKVYWTNFLNRYPPIPQDFPHMKNRADVVEAMTFIDSRNDPSAAKAYKDLGQKEYYKKNYAKAIEYYKRAVEVDPKYDIAYNNIGSVYFFLKDYRNAIQYWEQAVILNPQENKDLYLNIGAVYREYITNYSKSIYFLKKHLEMNPGDPQKPSIEYAIQEMQSKLSADK